MREDVRKLRQLRDRQKKDKTEDLPIISNYTWENKPNENRKYLKTFQEGLKNYRDNEYMTEILKEKLFLNNKHMDLDLLHSLAEYMVQNNGGCPVKIYRTPENGTH